MSMTIDYYDDAGTLHRSSIELPSICPRCNTGISPVFQHAYLHKTNLYAFFKCPVCGQAFFAEYIYKSPHITYISSIPSPAETRSFPESILTISPNFVEIYNQSYLTEQSGHTFICGMGYRKALEFLVKDYAIYIAPDDEETITKLSLKQCIDKYIEAPNIKTLATACAWIGNDETHYERKHPDYSCADLKQFINALISYIDMNYSCLLADALIHDQEKQDPQ